MNTVLIVARLLLAVVFLVAAVAKLADMSGSRRALEDFHVPGALIAPSALALPVLEVTAAVLLVFKPTAQDGAGLAAVLLLAFVGGIVAALRRGVAPDCHCFGQLHSRPAGKETIARNTALGAAAVFILASGPGPALVSWLNTTRPELVALSGAGVLAVVLGYACLSLWRDNRELRGQGQALDSTRQLEVGQLMPKFEAQTLDADDVRSDDLLTAEHRTVVVFTSASCGPCRGLLPELARWREMLVGRLGIHVLASGDVEQNQGLATEYSVPLLLDPNGTAARSFGIQGTPSAVEIDTDGRLASPPAAGAPAIEALIRAALKRPTAESGLEVRHVSPASHIPARETAS